MTIPAEIMPRFYTDPDIVSVLDRENPGVECGFSKQLPLKELEAIAVDFNSGHSNPDDYWWTPIGFLS